MLQASMRGRVLGLTTAALVSMTGCGSLHTTGAGRSQVAEPPLGAVPKVTDWRQITLPLDAYVLTIRDSIPIERAEYQQMKSCMRRFGFTFDAPPWWEKYDPKALDVKQPTHYRLYGLLDEAHAAREGYHVTGRPTPKELEYSKQEHSADYHNVGAAKLGGGTYKGQRIPDGGCIGEARRTVAAGGPAFDSSLPERLSNESWTLSNRDSRVAAALASWSACMAGSGFHYRTPMDANDDNRWSGDKASRAEIAVALADVRCKKQTNLTGIRMAVDAAYQRVAMKAHARELDAVRAGQQRQLRNAAQVIATE